PGWIAKRVGVSCAEEKAALDRMTDLGAISLVEGKFRANPVRLHIDSHADFDCFKKTRQYWLARASDFVGSMQIPNKRNLFGYLTYSCSEKARTEIVEKYSQFLAEVRFIVENDADQPESIQLLNIQLFDPAKI